MKAREPEKRRSAAVVALDAAFRRTRSEPCPAPDEPKALLRADLLARLAQHRVPEALAHALAGDAAKSGQEDAVRALAHALEPRMNARPIDYVRANAILLNGINGAGKSTVAAKIAAQAFLTGRRVKIVAFDPEARPLRILAERLDVKIVPMPNGQNLQKSVASACSRKSLIVIDAQGYNPRNAKARAAFSALGQIEHVERIGVVSALSDAVEIGEIAASLNVDRLIVTGLDLTRRWGAIAGAATSGIALAHVARSPFAGDGLEPLTPIALAQTLLGVRPDLQ